MIFAGSYFVKLSDQSDTLSNNTKELEFHDTTFFEVDQNGMLGKASVKRGTSNAGVLYLKSLKYHTDTIRMLRADSATLEEKKLYLDGNIRLNQKEGFVYEADNAVYDKDTKILQVTSPFRAILKKSVIKGRKLVYDTGRKEANASMIDAVLFTAGEDK